MPNKVRETVSWMEMHMRKPGLPVLRGLGDLVQEDYAVAGGRIPAAELQCLSDLYGMFCNPDKTMESYLPRGLQLYDMLVLVRQVQGREKLTYPMLLLPESALADFEAQGLTTNTKPKADHSTYPPTYMSDVWLISIRLRWPSLTLPHKSS